MKKTMYIVKKDTDIILMTPSSSEAIKKLMALLEHDRTRCKSQIEQIKRGLHAYEEARAILADATGIPYNYENDMPQYSKARDIVEKKVEELKELNEWIDEIASEAPNVLCDNLTHTNGVIKYRIVKAEYTEISAD